MSDFWAGAGAALTGAFIGGGFTAVAAVLQARSSLRAVDHELRQMFEHEREQNSEVFIRDALKRRLADLSEVARVFDIVLDQHIECIAATAHCDSATIPLAELRKARRNLYAGDDMYAYRDLPVAEDCESGAYLDVLCELIEAPSAASLGVEIVNAARECSKFSGHHCNYHDVAWYGLGECEASMEAFRRARDGLMA